MSKLCFVATIPGVVHAFLKGHIRAAEKQWQVKIITHPHGAELLSDLGAEFIPLEIERKASPLRDMLALMRLVVIFRRERFDLVHSIMPKTGLLAMLAAYLTGVPNRIHTFTGQVWATKSGWQRGFLKMIDRLIVSLATDILIDSPSQRDFLISEGVLPKNRGVVIGHGSICGVDADRFQPQAGVRQLVRSELNIGSDQPLILFLGRLNRDKGMLDLAAAFLEILRQKPDAILLLVGAEEDVPYTRIQEICGSDRLRRVSFTPEPERYMTAADIFCLPSYREGFGQVVIEAAACCVPTVATKIYGITDAVEDGKTGLLYPAGDVDGLTKALLKLISDVELRKQMGLAARMRAIELFSAQKITAEMHNYYHSLLQVHRNKAGAI